MPFMLASFRGAFSPAWHKGKPNTVCLQLTSPSASVASSRPRTTAFSHTKEKAQKILKDIKT